ncbi:phytanoyl-CoA dioxygenase family protein [Flavobacterium sp. WW92]|uniref:phytanoyl-CoA dioxygenase family protein n=1 Tax=unclassified Flavobacterium TaxID=196869 RepID=UPI0022259794|nr:MULTISPECIES: phytanoyl-CoA dioxygenase family protein [unclassified Flavobacterium]WDO12998.1 phytanoyl-CoA dioxygenase family protein [Flavobacterium sp. WW92]
MDDFLDKKELEERGFTIINSVYSREEINSIKEFINSQDTSSPIFRKSENLFAIRQFIKELPQIKSMVFNDKLKSIINAIEKNAFIVKSIYFDKPEKSNWFVAYHQDLTISVDKKESIEGFGPWTSKHNQFAVQPPLDILENIFTIRIHLDDTDENNGALKVIDGSHLKKIFRPETINYANEKEIFCNVEAGGIMLMKPLLLHGSNRTSNQKRRRVIHIEFSNKVLPELIKWSEFTQINS